MNKGCRSAHLAHRAFYMLFNVALTLLRFLAAAVFFRVMLGGSKCCRRRASEIIDSCCTLLVKRRRNPSKLSPSLIRSSTKEIPNSLLGDRLMCHRSDNHLKCR